MKTSICIATLLAAGCCFAQRGAPTKPGHPPMMAGPKAAHMRPIPVRSKNEKEVTVVGMVKGKPMGKTFTLAGKGGTYTVDTSKSGLRYMGKFFPIAKLSAGSSVSATGRAAGTVLQATSVKVNHIRMSKVAQPMSRKPSKPAVRKAVKKAGH